MKSRNVYKSSKLTLFSSVCSGTNKKPCLAEIVHKEGSVCASVQSFEGGGVGVGSVLVSFLTQSN